MGLVLRFGYDYRQQPFAIISILELDKRLRQVPQLQHVTSRIDAFADVIRATASQFTARRHHLMRNG